MVFWEATKEYAYANIVCCVLVLAAFVGIILLTIKGVIPFIQILRSGEVSKRACYLGLGIFFLLIAVLSVASGYLGYDLCKTASFEYNCSKGNYDGICGDVQLISSTPEYYRGDLMGYKVVLQMDDKVISPSDNFQENMIVLFESDKPLEIKYKEVGNNEIYTWEISLVL